MRKAITINKRVAMEDKQTRNEGEWAETRRYAYMPQETTQALSSLRFNKSTGRMSKTCVMVIGFVKNVTEIYCSVMPCHGLTNPRLSLNVPVE